MAEIAPVIREYVAAESAPLIERNAALEARIAELEAREQAPPERGEPGPQGEPGRDGEVDMEAVRELIADAAKEQVAALASTLPLPEKGDKGDKGDPGERGEKGEPGEKGADGRDGVGLADALIDADGRLVLTMTDGTTKALGVVKGADGRDGEPGKTFTLDDFEVVPMDERTIKMGFVYGEVMHSFELEFPVPIYRGRFQIGEKYARGDLATWGGHLWHCDEDRGKKPDEPESGWTLAVKRGRDGKDYKSS
jgi:hypothetical protein